MGIIVCACDMSTVVGELAARLLSTDRIQGQGKLKSETPISQQANKQKLFAYFVILPRNHTLMDNPFTSQT